MDTIELSVTEKLGEEEEHSTFLEKLLCALYGEGWDKLTISDAQEWHKNTLRNMVGGENTTEHINDELKTFIRDITLFLQKHENYTTPKTAPMFQRAYRLYVKYDVEGGE